MIVHFKVMKKVYGQAFFDIYYSPSVVIYFGSITEV